MTLGKTIGELSRDIRETEAEDKAARRAILAARRADEAAAVSAMLAALEELMGNTLSASSWNRASAAIAQAKAAGIKGEG